MSLFRHIEQPEYEILENNYAGHFELREYPRSAWFVTTLTDVPFESAMHVGFSRLFRFITRNNFPMKAPVVILESMDKQNAYDVMFFAGQDALMGATQDDDADTDDELIRVVHFPRMHVFAHRFGGWMDARSVYNQLNTLAQFLPETNHPLRWAAAGFSSPMRILNRHNELWFLFDSRAH